MEALVVACAVLVALVLIDAGYWIAVSLMRWSPVLIVGAAMGWFTHRQGLALTALAAGALASIAVRHRLRRAEENERPERLA